MGLVHSCAHRFQGRGIEYDDLVSAGNIGLIKAIDHFEPQRGLRLSTYAVPVILGEMRRLFREGGTVKVGRTLKELSLKVAREQEIFSKEFGREPKIGELASRLGVEPEEVAQALNAALPALSLTAHDDGDGGESSGQIDIRVEAPEETISDLLALRQAVGTLGEKDQRLIILRYFGSKTQTQTAQALGMTQVQVSRREKVILNELRKQLIC